MYSHRQAHERALNLRAAWRDANADFKILGNQDDSGLNDEGNPALDTPLNIPPGCDHVPYTVELARLVGKVYADCGRAIASNQQALAMVEAMLEEEGKRIDRGETAAETKQRADDRTAWWLAERKKRVEAWKEDDDRYKSGKKKRKPRT